MFSKKEQKNNRLKSKSQTKFLCFKNAEVPLANETFGGVQSYSWLYT